MARGPTYRVPFRRRREGKTDYRKRLKLLRSGLPRLVVRNTNRNIIVQVINYHPNGDRIVSSAISSELRKLGWKGSTKNLPCAYLTGYLAARRALAKGVKSAVLDIGLHRPSKGARVFSALKGAIDAGMLIPHGEEKVPDEDRIRGKHIGDGVAKMFEDVRKKLMETTEG